MKNVNTKSTLIKTKSSPSVGSKVRDKPVNKKNVMNTIHNVTVASPPSSASKERSASTPDVKLEGSSLNHSRTLTRTIDPEDSILNKQKKLKEQAKLKPKEPVKKAISYELKSQIEPEVQTKPKDITKLKESVQRSISYELNFEEPKKPVKPIDTQDEDDYNYESDFESYESDFEAEVPSSSSSKSLSELHESSDENEINEPSHNNDNRGNHPAKLDKERIDSGSFEMSSKKPVTPLSAHYDSIDDTINSHDSGISYDDLKQAVSPKVHELYKRGRELMKKITFDEMAFDIHECKPMPYETFMALYGGQVNMFQVSTQCDSVTTVDEAQTDPITKAEMWTQFPSKFTKIGLEALHSKLYNEEKLGVGDGTAEESCRDKDESEQFSEHIEAINNFSKSEEIAVKLQTTFDSVELQRFVERAAMTVSNVMDNQQKMQELKPSRISISRGFTHLKFNNVAMLHETIIKKIYTNLNVSNFLVTVHKCKSSQQNFLCRWDILNTKLPLKIFSSWSDVKCIEIHELQRDVIVGGCSDGTISLWDSQEFLEWKDDNESTSCIKPCEIISLNQSSNEFALDNVVALKCLPYREFNKTSSMFAQSQVSQICSLHRNGTIIIWTISRVQVDNDVGKRAELDYTHASSRVKLIKNVTIDLNASSKGVEKENVRRKSAFEKTRYYFENDLFNDKVLKELQEIDSSQMIKAKSPLRDDQLMRFNGLSVNLNEILIASDLNFVMAVSRLNLGDKTRKILTNDSNVIAPTAIQIHPTNKNVLVVGQANGEVKFIKLYDDDKNSRNSSIKSAKKSGDASGFSDILSKSCAFQNIVEKEKKLYNETQALNNLESDELKAFLVNEALSQQFVANHSTSFEDKLKVSFDKNIFNSFEVSVGSVSSLEFNKTGEFLFVLCGKQMRIFNCWTNSEVEQQDKTKFGDVRCVQGADSAEYLVSFQLRTFYLIKKLIFSL